MTSRRQSPAVYRRRRLLAALLAVLLLALVLWGVRAVIDAFDAEEPESGTQQASGEDQDENGSTTAPSPTAEAEDEDQEEEPSVPEGHCAPSDIQVQARTHEESYPAGVAPLLIMEIENTGSETCTLDVGTYEQIFRVSYGGRELFNTGQCGGRGSSLEMEFEPGQTERSQLVWPRSDSGVDCTEPAELTTGDYELSVSVSGIRSEPYTFHVTGVSP